MSIYDIKISEITRQYLEYMDEMKKLIVGSEEFEIVDDKARNAIDGAINPENFTGNNDATRLQAAIDYAIANNYLTLNKDIIGDLSNINDVSF